MISSIYAISFLSFSLFFLKHNVLVEKICCQHCCYWDKFFQQLRVHAYIRLQQNLVMYGKDNNLKKQKGALHVGLDFCTIYKYFYLHNSSLLMKSKQFTILTKMF